MTEEELFELVKAEHAKHDEFASTPPFNELTDFDMQGLRALLAVVNEETEKLRAEIDRLKDIINHNLEEQLYCERVQGKKILDVLEENRQLKSHIETIDSYYCPTNCVAMAAERIATGKQLGEK